MSLPCNLIFLVLCMFQNFTYITNNLLLVLSPPMDTNFLLIFLIFSFVSPIASVVDPTQHFPQNFQGELSVNASYINMVSFDFGGISRVKPLAVLYPDSADDIASLTRAAYNSAAQGSAFSVSARGCGHSIYGQAQTSSGVVIDMSGSKGSKVRKGRLGLPYISVGNKNSYVDVWGGVLWIDLLKWTLKYEMAPRSWTDYLYLSVGGTLSNAGISGQTYKHGPQINNVYELDVVTGKGELLTCSKEQNSDLFHGVLGGLGQFGIITRARIALEPAPQRVRWIRVLYNNFIKFTKDQEFLITLHGHPPSQRFDYVAGFVAVEKRLINKWRSSFFFLSNPVKLTSLLTYGGSLYCLEITKNYDESFANTVDQEVEALLKKLDFIPSSVFTADVTYLDFLDRVHKEELELRSKGLWDVPHPWLNLFVPKSRIVDFDNGVFKGILGNKTSDTILIYPMNKNKWDYKTSVVTPDEDVFYNVALLQSASDSSNETQTLEYLTDQNQRILEYCDEAGIKVKQYLPRYNTQEEWKVHFGDKWELFVKRKMEFDTKYILATGQMIFQPSFSSYDPWHCDELVLDTFCKNRTVNKCMPY